MNVYGIIGIGIFAWLIFASIDQCDKRDGFAEPRRLTRVARAAAPIETRSEPPESVTVGRVVSGDPGLIIKSVSRDFDVPAGALYGIWMKESSGLRSGWGSSPGWLSAAEQSAPGSKCHGHYGSARCGRWWRALEVICNQRRPDGSAVCDPRQVRTSYALAMGPMQILPTHLADERPDGTFAWTGNVVDYDGDGVVDPHSLPDALAIAAKLIRRFYDREQDWRRAVNRYYGSQTAGYFVGTDSSVGVAEHWERWCSVPGHCRERYRDNGLVASN